MLVDDARLSARAIARKIAMSPGAISERIDRLQRLGVLSGYHAQVHAELLGYGLQVIIGMQTEQGPVLQEHLDQMLSIPEVEGSYTVTGRWDLVLILRLADQEHLRDVLFNHVWRIPGFRRSETMIVLEANKVSAPWRPPWSDDGDVSVLPEGNPNA